MKKKMASRVIFIEENFVLKLLKVSCFVLYLSCVIRLHFMGTLFGGRKWRSWWNFSKCGYLILKV
jgi:hypothetical protein